VSRKNVVIIMPLTTTVPTPYHVEMLVSGIVSYVDKLKSDLQESSRHMEDGALEIVLSIRVLPLLRSYWRYQPSTEEPHYALVKRNLLPEVEKPRLLQYEQHDALWQLLIPQVKQKLQECELLREKTILPVEITITIEKESDHINELLLRYTNYSEAVSNICKKNRGKNLCLIVDTNLAKSALSNYDNNKAPWTKMMEQHPVHVCIMPRGKGITDEDDGSIRFLSRFPLGRYTLSHRMPSSASFHSSTGLITALAILCHQEKFDQLTLNGIRSEVPREGVFRYPELVTLFKGVTDANFPEKKVEIFNNLTTSLQVEYNKSPEYFEKLAMTLKNGKTASTTTAGGSAPFDGFKQIGMAIDLLKRGTPRTDEPSYAITPEAAQLRHAWGLKNAVANVLHINSEKYGQTLEEKITKLHEMLQAANNDTILTKEMGLFGMGFFSGQGKTKPYQDVVEAIKDATKQILKPEDDTNFHPTQKMLNTAIEILNTERGRGPHLYNRVMGGATSYREMEIVLRALQDRIPTAPSQPTSPRV